MMAESADCCARYHGSGAKLSPCGVRVSPADEQLMVVVVGHESVVLDIVVLLCDVIGISLHHESLHALIVRTPQLELDDDDCASALLSILCVSLKLLLSVRSGIR